jgi:hypothetical protein
MHDRPPRQANGLGTTSLILSTLSLFLVFSLGVCAGVGKEQGWLKPLETILFLIGASSAFLGVLGVLLGLGGLVARNRTRGTAFFGLLFGAASVALFLAIVQAAQRG